MTQPLVSIVAPCYNGELYVNRFLKSIYNQEYPNIELIFVNDGSTDRTEEVVLSYKEAFERKGFQLKYVKQDNAGQAAALNNGLKYVKGEFLTWMDSDDEISADFIRERVVYLQTHDNQVYCYGKVVWIDESTSKKIKVIGKRTENGEKCFFKDIMLYKSVFFPGFTVRMSALDRVIKNREIYAGEGGQNAQLLLPLSWYYGEPGFVEKSEYIYYVRKNSHSHSIRTGEQTVQQIINYERIVKATISQIEDQSVWDVYKEAERKYALERFGNAVDTKEPELIKRQYRNLKEKHCANLKKWLLMVKYTNPYVRRIFGIS